MGRRDGRRGNRTPQGGALTLAQRFRALFAGQSDAVFLEAQNATTTTWVDSLDATHVLTVNGTAIAAPAASATFNGAVGLTLTGAQHFVSNRAPTRFKKLHTNSGCTAVSVYAPTSLASNDAFWSTFTGAAVPGAWQYGILTGTNNTQVTSAKTGSLSSNTGGAGAVAVGVPTALEYYADVTNTPDIEYLQDGVSIYTGDYSALSDTADQAQTLLIGALSAAGGNRLHAEVRAFYFLPYVLSAPQRVVMREYLAQVT